MGLIFSIIVKLHTLGRMTFLQNFQNLSQWIFLVKSIQYIFWICVHFSLVLRSRWKVIISYPAKPTFGCSFLRKCSKGMGVIILHQICGWKDFLYVYIISVDSIGVERLSFKILYSLQKLYCVKLNIRVKYKPYRTKFGSLCSENVTHILSNNKFNNTGK